jgi:curved DNA-binding protein CbpA
VDTPRGLGGFANPFSATIRPSYRFAASLARLVPDLRVYERAFLSFSRLCADECRCRGPVWAAHGGAMQPGAEQSARELGIPKLAEGWDPVNAPLSPSEGFLLSRIDGHTPWAQLRQIGGIPPHDVDDCIERWLTEGLVTLAAVRSEFPARPQIDPSLDIETELQQQILDFESQLGRSYFEILDISRDADREEIKRAYFRLSKTFHPDRYFRREIGAFSGCLDRIFRKLVEAYELLSDPNTRSEIERTLGASEPAPPCAKEAGGAQRALINTPKKLTRRETLDRLRRHFKMPESVMAERRASAAEFYKSAMIAVQRGKWQESAQCVRLAIAFDPWKDEYRAEFVEIQVKSHQQRVDQMLDETAEGWDESNVGAALKLLEEILAYRPADSAANQQAAELALATGTNDKALEYAQVANDHAPDSVPILMTLARAMRRCGMREKAIKNLKQAAELEPKNSEVKAELNELRRARRRS